MDAIVVRAQDLKAQNLSAQKKPETLTVALSQFPISFNPKDLSTSTNQFVILQMACPLLKQVSNKVLPHNANCQWNSKKQSETRVTCKINNSIKTSEGQTVTAQNYYDFFIDFINPQAPALRADLLFPIKNVESYLKGKSSIQNLGIKIVSPFVLEFELEKPFKEFLYLLANPLLSPHDKTLKNSCGPYFIEQINTGQSVVFKKNPYSTHPYSKAPQYIKYLVIDDQTLTLKSYKEGHIDILRNLPTSLIPQMEKLPDLVKVNLIRLDSLFFNPSLQKTQLPKLLSQSIDYTIWQKIFYALPRPGCFGVPAEWTLNQPVCHEQNLNEVQTTESIKNLKSLVSQLKTPLTLYYSKAGGVDHERGSVFLQSEWKKNLNLPVLIEPIENKSFIAKYKTRELPFYRKGFTPERPTCLAVLETFGSQNPNNHIQFNNPELDHIIIKMSGLETQNKSYQNFCKQGLTLLKDKAGLIPTGPIYMSYLINPKWTSIFIDELGRLDVTQAHLK